MQSIKLNDIIDFNPKVKLEKGDAYSFIPMENLTPEVKFVSDIEKKEWQGQSSSKFENGDVLFARIYPCLDNRKIAVAKTGGKGFGSTEFFVIRAKEGLADQNFVYYLSTSDLIVQTAINSYVGASGRQRADLKFIKNSQFDLPTYDNQKKIAAILSTYDDLINVDKSQIKILENMATELYKEWFVRFRFPNWQNTTFEKGIPKSWHPVKMSELVSYYIGGGWGEDSPDMEYSEEAYVIRGTDIPKVDQMIEKGVPYRYHKPSNLQSRQLKEFDLVFEVSGGSTNQLLGRNVMISNTLLESFNNKVMCASFCKLIRFDLKKVNPYFMKYYMKLYYDYDLVGVYQVQSTGISNYQFESFLKHQLVIVPERSVMDSFENLVRPIIKKIESLGQQVKILESVKAELIPRLISGKLSVDELDIDYPPSMQKSNEAEEKYS